jgi:hypothetical protein
MATATITMDVSGEAAGLRLRLPAVFFPGILINHLRKIASDVTQWIITQS